MKTFKLITLVDKANLNETISGAGIEFKGSFKQSKIKVLEYATKKFNFFNAMKGMGNIEVYYWITYNDKQVLTGFINKYNVKNINVL